MVNLELTEEEISLLVVGASLGITQLASNTERKKLRRLVQKIAKRSCDDEPENRTD